MGKIALKYLLCLVFWCATGSAQALSLSEIELKSYLNETLDARVWLSGISAEDLESLEVGLVVTDAATGQSPGSLNAELMNDTSGHYVQVASKTVIREPVVSFTLELVWPSGRLQREFSLLMDPKK